MDPERKTLASSLIDTSQQPWDDVSPWQGGQMERSGLKPQYSSPLPLPFASTSTALQQSEFDDDVSLPPGQMVPGASIEAGRAKKGSAGAGMTRGQPSQPSQPQQQPQQQPGRFKKSFAGRGKRTTVIEVFAGSALLTGSALPATHEEIDFSLPLPSSPFVGHHDKRQTFQEEQEQEEQEQDDEASFIKHLKRHHRREEKKVRKQDAAIRRHHVSSATAGTEVHRQLHHQRPLTDLELFNLPAVETVGGLLPPSAFATHGDPLFQAANLMGQPRYHRTRTHGTDSEHPLAVSDYGSQAAISRSARHGDHRVREQGIGKELVETTNLAPAHTTIGPHPTLQPTEVEASESREVALLYWEREERDQVIGLGNRASASHQPHNRVPLQLSLREAPPFLPSTAGSAAHQMTEAEVRELRASFVSVAKEIVEEKNLQERIREHLQHPAPVDAGDDLPPGEGHFPMAPSLSLPSPNPLPGASLISVGSTNSAILSEVGAVGPLPSTDSLPSRLGTQAAAAETSTSFASREPPLASSSDFVPVSSVPLSEAQAQGTLLPSASTSIPLATASTSTRVMITDKNGEL